MMNHLLIRFAQAQPSWLPGYTAGGDNSSKAITDPKAAVIIQIVFSIFGAVAVLVITIAGIQYILSQGDPQKVAKAKNTILYAIVGLVVSLLGYSIVAYIVRKLG